MKILELEELARKVQFLRSKGNKIVLCHGCFDLMHIGHIKYFQASKKMGDILVVTVTPDIYVDKEPNRPAFDQNLRAESIAALECVDYVSINKWPTAEETLRLLKPDIYVKGQEFENLEDKTGKVQREYEVAKEIGIEMRFTKEIVFSSTKLLNQYFKINNCLNIYPDDTKNFLKEFSEKYSYDEIAEKLDDLKKLKVIIIGDGIIDEYHYCRSMGKSAKAPLVVQRYTTHEIFAGGAFIVANHIAGLCDNVQLVTLLGKEDSREDFVINNLKPNISRKFFYRYDGPTVHKKRYIEQYLNQKLFEINYLNNNFINSECESDIIDYLRLTIPEYDLVLISDFGHGFITDNIIKVIENFSRTFAVNTQTNAANTGYNMITKYHHPNFICIDETEARLGIQNRFGDIEDVVQMLSRSLNAESVIITLGKKGSIGIDTKKEINRTPIFSTKVIDTVGAGDAFFAFTAPCFAQRMPLDLISFIGNSTGALAVQIIGNKKPVEKYELLEFIKTILIK